MGGPNAFPNSPTLLSSFLAAAFLFVSLDLSFAIAPSSSALLQIAHLADANGKPCWRLATFYAVLADEPHAAAARPKTVPCFESAGACWVSADQLDGIPLRSERIPRTWFPHFAAGGKPLPLELPPDQAHLFPDVEF